MEEPMAGLGIPDRSAFWVGGTGGVLLHGETGFIATRIQAMLDSTAAMQRELDALTVLLASDGTPRGEGVDALRAGIRAAHVAMGALGADAASALSDALRSAAPASTSMAPALDDRQHEADIPPAR
jgi:hypothetical protein